MRRIALALLLLAGADELRAQGASPHTRLEGRQCADCHQTTANWKSISFAHDRTGFSLRGQHRVAPCTGCHDVRDFAAARGTCATCHADPHRGDAGARCESCHTVDAWRDIDAPQAHARTRLPDLGVHAVLRCDDCHHRTGARPFTSPVTPCAGCHIATYQATVNPPHQPSGFSTTCDQCHQLATWSFALFAQHDAVFPIYTGEHAHSWQSCSSCHPAANDFRQYTCTTCHSQPATDPRHSGIPDYQWTSTACLSCHPQGRGGLVNHEAIFPLNSGPHAGTWQGRCESCHVDPATRLTFSCMTSGCHPQPETNAFHDRMATYAYDARPCLACHPTGLRGRYTAHDPFFPVYTGSHRGRWASCATCHTANGDRSVFTCAGGGCHNQTDMNNHHRGVRNYDPTPPGCLTCHRNGRTP